MSKQAEIVKRLTDKELLLNLYITQFIIIVAVFLLSRIIQGDWFFVFTLFFWEWKHALLGGFVALIIVVIELLLVKVVPRSWLDDGGVNERVFQKRSPIHILIIASIVGISEELLFRGVLQASFGIIPASLLFALIHIRYLQNFFLFSFTIGLSFLLGLLFIYTGNLLTVIVSHIVIDLLLGLAIRYKIYKF
ncbi:type II CAAX endopeptidase family protein [Evansella cellulosilytica]|uniref:Abortive infection protein n=1 Tax=Evansella cellulosilytica (strain ATCC 21833 / DSM 2522 / FERM P-1141 / JCM 9156 / N-4) TaxID=649639 RepID=E6TYP5_EVAC2|nr:type II CAAX endopeptidase family protein [Evansella cellulosilytica]ADU30095.1 Abortive infection protein [Evansella cellulosilytica DSM 2522]